MRQGISRCLPCLKENILGQEKYPESAGIRAAWFDDYVLNAFVTIHFVFRYIIFFPKMV